DRLADAERDGNRVGNQRDPEPERDGDGHLLQDQIHHRDVAKVALTEIETDVVPDHQQEAFMRRLVEAELLFQLLNELGVKALRTAIAGVDARAFKLAGIHGLAAADARVGTASLTGDLSYDLLDRAAGCELDDDEGNEHDPKKGGDHEEQTPENIGSHQTRSPSQKQPSARTAARPNAKPECFMCRRGTPSFANGLRLFLVVPPQRLYGEAVVGLRLLEAELVPIGNAMIRCIPIWNPVETCAQDPVQ